MYGTRMQHLIWAKNCFLRVISQRDLRYIRMVRHHVRAAFAR